MLTVSQPVLVEFVFRPVGTAEILVTPPVASGGGGSYTHPATHPPSIIAQDASNRFVTDTQITNWTAAFSWGNHATAGYALASNLLTPVPAGAVFTDTTYSVGDGGLTQINFTTTLRDKLDVIEAGANNYTHPASHAATMITQDSTHRFITDTERTSWNASFSWGNHAGLYAASSHNHDGAYLALSSVVDDLTTASASAPLSANQGVVLKGLIDTINAALASDETTLDTLQEVVDFIELNRADLDALGIASIAGLQGALDGKANSSQVLTDVPLGAVFTDTTYSVGNNGLTEVNFTSALSSKLGGIESGATADQTGAEIKAAYEAEADTNAFTDGHKTKVDAISAFGQSLVDDADAAAARATLALGNVDNTSDADKPLSTAQAASIATKIGNVVDDTTPQLGGELDAQGNSIVSAGYIGVGTDSPAFDIHAISDTSTMLRLESYGGNTQVRGIAASGTTLSPLATLVNTLGFSFSAAGHDGTSVTPYRGQAGFRAEDAFTPTAQGMRFIIDTTKSGTTARSNKVIVTGDGSLLLNSASGSGEKVLVIGNGTAPSSSPADAVTLWSEDISSSAELRVRDEAGNVTTLSPHNFKHFEPEPDHEAPFSYYSKNEYIGTEINVDMLALALAVEKISGQKIVHISDIERRDWATDQLAIQEQVANNNAMRRSRISELETNIADYKAQIAALGDAEETEKQRKKLVSAIDNATEEIESLESEIKPDYEPKPEPDYIARARAAVESRKSNAPVLQVKGLIDFAKSIARSQIAAVIDPLTGKPVSTAKGKHAIERDITHTQANQAVVLNNPNTPDNLRNAIISAQGQVIVIQQAAAAVYQQIENGALVTKQEITAAFE